MEITDYQISIVLLLALIPGFLALNLGKKLNK